ncbi:unnamed protein product [Sphagnum jensenii]|uniref:Uncharacterized protein n=1 Tax=Sphagnum jensenii TaxID=128206 RepID=A0ABP0V8H0_9BRYO
MGEGVMEASLVFFGISNLVKAAEVAEEGVEGADDAGVPLCAVADASVSFKLNLNDVAAAAGANFDVRDGNGMPMTGLEALWRTGVFSIALLFFAAAEIVVAEFVEITEPLGVGAERFIAQDEQDFIIFCGLTMPVGRVSAAFVDCFTSAFWVPTELLSVFWGIKEFEGGLPGT